MFFGGFPSPVVCYIGFSACKWAAKGQIPIFPKNIFMLNKIQGFIVMCTLATV